MFLAPYCIHIIQQYSLHGQLIRTHDAHGSSSGGVKLRYPLLISGSCDKFNSSILVAGNVNPRLDVLSADGSFHTLPVDGIGQYPACARIHDGKLYVLC